MPRRVKVLHPRSLGITAARKAHFFNVASIELGNTTTKCILTSTNLNTAEIHQIAKAVKFTRDVRTPKDEEEIFGETLVGVKLTRESVSEFVSDIITNVLNSIGMDVEKDLDFAVRSTGVTAGFSSPEEVGEMVKALADGCLRAGIAPRKMTAPLSIDNLPPKLQEYTWIKQVYFDGAVASSLPPPDASIVGNEMEGELVTAGIKGAVKSTNIDFRNPVITLDFGTTLAGRVTDKSFPYSNTTGSFVGLAGAIPDSIVLGSGIIENRLGTALDLSIPRLRKPIDVPPELLEDIQDMISVQNIVKGTQRYGTVPVNTKVASEAGIVLMGVDVGKNGSKLSDVEKLGRVIYQEYGVQGLVTTMDLVQAKLVSRLLALAEENDLVLKETSLGLTGRAITTGLKPKIIASTLRTSDDNPWIEKHQFVVVEDGLAFGAAVAARCMNSLGTRNNPMGGRKGDKCIMGARMKRQRMDKS